MPNKIEVVEQEKLLPYLVSSFDMTVIFISLNDRCCIVANTYDSNNIHLYEKQFVIEGEEYSNWGNDDNYLKELIASKLGLEIKPIPVAVGDSIQITFDELPQ